jgi:hypothetical protein
MSMAHRRESNDANMAEALLSRRVAIRLPAERRRADAGAALVAGVAAGSALLSILVLFSVAFYDEPAWKVPQMIAATVRGAAAAEERVFVPSLAALGVAVHFTLSVLYALAFAGLVAETRRHTALLGLAFGVALYFVNLHGFTQLFAWFAELRTLDTLAAHGFFGLLLACIYKDTCVLR